VQCSFSSYLSAGGPGCVALRARQLVAARLAISLILSRVDRLGVGEDLARVWAAAVSVRVAAGGVSSRRHGSAGLPAASGTSEV